MDLKIRNLCDEGNTPGFRPHPSRKQEGQYAFPGAKELIHESLKGNTKPKGHFPSPDQWLSNLHAEISSYAFLDSIHLLTDPTRLIVSKMNSMHF